MLERDAKDSDRDQRQADHRKEDSDDSDEGQAVMEADESMLHNVDQETTNQDPPEEVPSGACSSSLAAKHRRANNVDDPPAKQPRADVDLTQEESICRARRQVRKSAKEYGANMSVTLTDLDYLLSIMLDTERRVCAVEQRCHKTDKQLSDTIDKLEDLSINAAPVGDQAPRILPIKFSTFEYIEQLGLTWTYPIMLEGFEDVFPCMMLALMKLQCEHCGAGPDDLAKFDNILATHRDHNPGGYDEEWHAWYRSAQQLWVTLPRGNHWFSLDDISSIEEAKTSEAYIALLKVIRATVDCSRTLAPILVRTYTMVGDEKCWRPLHSCGRHPFNPQNPWDFRSALMIGAEKYEAEVDLPHERREFWLHPFMGLLGEAMMDIRTELIDTFAEKNGPRQLNDRDFAQYMATNIWADNYTEPSHKTRYVAHFNQLVRARDAPEQNVGSGRSSRIGYYPENNPPAGGDNQQRGNRANVRSGNSYNMFQPFTQQNFQVGAADVLRAQNVENAPPPANGGEDREDGQLPDDRQEGGAAAPPEPVAQIALPENEVIPAAGFILAGDLPAEARDEIRLGLQRALRGEHHQLDIIYVSVPAISNDEVTALTALHRIQEGTLWAPNAQHRPAGEALNFFFTKPPWRDHYINMPRAEKWVLAMGDSTTVRLSIEYDRLKQNRNWGGGLKFFRNTFHGRRMGGIIPAVTGIYAPQRHYDAVLIKGVLDGLATLVGMGGTFCSEYTAHMLCQPMLHMVTRVREWLSAWRMADTHIYLCIISPVLSNPLSRNTRPSEIEEASLWVRNLEYQVWAYFRQVPGITVLQPVKWLCTNPHWFSQFSDVRTAYLFGCQRDGIHLSHLFDAIVTRELVKAMSLNETFVHLKRCCASTQHVLSKITPMATGSRGGSGRPRRTPASRLGGGSRPIWSCPPLEASGRPTSKKLCAS